VPAKAEGLAETSCRWPEVVGDRGPTLTVRDDLPTLQPLRLPTAVRNELMPIKEGDKLPEATMHIIKEGRPTPVTTDELFKGKRAVVFAVPGAYTPTCSMAHLPGYVVNADKLKEKGTDSIICLSVNDAFVMDSWGKDKNAEQILMIGDGNGEFTRKLGLEMDGSGFGLGTRSQRYAMIVEDGVVSKLAVEEPGKFEVSKAESILDAL
jgi:glutaredoxin/glutathione-dependent peroxiredoxin